MRYGCIHLTLSWNDRRLNGIPIMFFTWNWCVLDHLMPTGTTVNGQYYCTLLQDKLRLALHRKQLQLLKHGVIFPQNNAKPHCHRDVQNLMNAGAGGCWQIFPTLQILPHVITDCLYVWKNILRVDDLNRKTVSTLLSLSPYITWARKNTELQLIVYHRDGKSVWTMLVITLSWEHMCKRSGISVVLLSCIL